MTNSTKSLRHFAAPALLGLGMLSFAGKAEAQCAAAVATDFKKETLADGGLLKEPIELTVSKDGRVFVVERGGDIHMYDPVSKTMMLAAHMDTYIYRGTEYDVGGPLGIAVAPNFPTDNWVYIYWAPKSTWNGVANKENGKGTYRLARYRFVANKIDLTTEQTLIEVNAGWETHNGGSLKFGKNDDLYLSLGDNHNPGCSAQYSPMDEQAGHFWCDDQGTTANTNELRGKIIRIHPEADMTKPCEGCQGKYYTIPAGNLKEKYSSLWSTPDLAAKVKPEIYTMGHRNPYRIFPDPVTGKLFIAENGPAAGSASDRGPGGADQWKVTDEAAFLGYPYFLKDNQAYCHWSYSQNACVAIQGQTSMKYDPAKPVNYSPNNTGVNILPPAKPAALWEHDGNEADPIPGLKACGPGAGPVYHFDAALNSKTKFPQDFDNKWIFFAIFSSSWQPKLATPPSNFSKITAATNPPWGNLNFTTGLHDMEFGPGDGALYVVDYGGAMYTANGNAGLFRVSYNGCLPPVALHPSKQTAMGDLAYAGLDGRSLVIPAGANAVEVFDLAGKKVWEKSLRGSAESRVELPGELARSLFRVRWQ